MNSWKRQPIFVSSTFRDMNAERDVIAERVVPELEELANEFGRLPQLIDLRWGVETGSLQDSHNKEEKVLSVCLDEIDRSRPFIIVLLGDRYGWVPDEHIMSRITDEKGFRSELQKKSVTALEIEYGVLSRRQDDVRCFFYFRNPLPYKKMSRPDRKVYSDLYTDKKSFKKLEELKNRITTLFPDRVRTYDCEWNENAGRITGLEGLAAQIVKDVRSELEKECSEEVEQIRKSGWVVQEKWLQNGYLAEQESKVCGRDYLLNAYDYSHEDYASVAPLTIFSGDEIDGSQVLYQRLVSKLNSNNDEIVLPYAFRVTMRAYHSQTMIAIWCQMLSEELGKQENYSEMDYLELQAQFMALAEEAVGQGKRISLVIFGIEKSRDDNVPIHFIRSISTSNLKDSIKTFVFLTDTTQDFSIFFSDINLDSVLIQPLEETDIFSIIIEMAEEYRKQLPAEIVQNIAAKGSIYLPGGYAYLQMLISDLAMMDASDYSELAIKYKRETPEKQLELYLKDKVKTTFDNLELLVLDIFARLLKKLSPKFLIRLIGMLVSSPDGLREDDIIWMFNNYFKTKDFEADFAIALKWLKPQIVRTPGGILRFRSKKYEASAKIAAFEVADEVNNALSERLAMLPDDDPIKREDGLVFFARTGNTEQFYRLLATFDPENDYDKDLVRVAKKLFSDDVMTPFASGKAFIEMLTTGVTFNNVKQLIKAYCECFHPWLIQSDMGLFIETMTTTLYMKAKMMLQISDYLPLLKSMSSLPDTGNQDTRFFQSEALDELKKEFAETGNIDYIVPITSLIKTEGNHTVNYLTEDVLQEYDNYIRVLSTMPEQKFGLCEFYEHIYNNYMHWGEKEKAMDYLDKAIEVCESENASEKSVGWGLKLANLQVEKLKEIDYRKEESKATSLMESSLEIFRKCYASNQSRIVILTLANQFLALGELEMKMNKGCSIMEEGKGFAEAYHRYANWEESETLLNRYIQLIDWWHEEQSRLSEIISQSGASDINTAYEEYVNKYESIIDELLEFYDNMFLDKDIARNRLPVDFMVTDEIFQKEFAFVKSMTYGKKEYLFNSKFTYLLLLMYFQKGDAETAFTMFRTILGNALKVDVSEYTIDDIGEYTSQLTSIPMWLYGNPDFLTAYKARTDEFLEMVDRWAGTDSMRNLQKQMSHTSVKFTYNSLGGK